MASAIEFCLLGPLRVRVDGAQVRIPRGKQRALLAALLLQAGRTVTAGQLAELVWGASPPPSSAVTLQNYVKRLRGILGRDRDRIVTQPGGYLIRVDPGELDIAAMQEKLAGAHEAARDGAWPDAAMQASAALDLWRGEPLCDVDLGVVAAQEVARLTELHFQARALRLEAGLQLGRHAELAAEARQLAAEAPLREQLHALLMRALYQCGRRAEALEAYQDARRVLVDELGCEPGPELRALHRQILQDSPALRPAAPPVVPQVPVPRQLPAAVAGFTGRAAQLQTLTQIADQARAGTAGTVVIAAIDGTAGVGKTALALHWAHRVADRYTDGQLYVNLRGYDSSGAPAAPAEAVRGFLDALGVPPERIPPQPDAQAGLYRSLLADRKMLIVLDHARDEAQVRPLLPASPGSLVLVTSRSQLAGLAATDGARLLSLDVLARDEAVQLLTSRLGAERAAAEPAAVSEIAALCAHLPLALAMAAARAAARPRLPLAVLAADLRGPDGWLQATLSQFGVVTCVADADGGDAPAIPRSGTSAARGHTPVTISQLPPPVPHFAGRVLELTQLNELLDGDLDGRAVAVIGGTAGAGKTCLAVHWAHRAARLFPDGQLYLNLNGFGPAGAPLAPADALAVLLETLQVPAAQIPVTLAGRTSLWRSLTAARRILIILDNARNEHQVRPLLPGGQCVVIATSRSRLTGLVALEGALSLTLGQLSLAESRQLLTGRLGARFVAADLDATDRLIKACARLPLALAIAAALIATRPGSSMQLAARELTDAADIIEALDAGEAAASLRMVFTWSHRALSPPAARLFCLLAEHPGPDISRAAAASLAGVHAGEARAALNELARANLISEQGNQRYSLHDLLRQFAAGQLSELHSPAERRAAGQRMLDHYTRTATTAALAISPQRTLTTPGQPVPLVRPEPIASQAEAFDWLRSEHQVLMRAIAYAAGTGADQYAWRLPLALTDFHDRAGYWHDWAACQQIALAAAERTRDTAAQSNAHRYLGRASCMLQRHDDALTHLTRSVELRQQIGPPIAEAGIHLDLCRLHEHDSNPDEALQSAQRALALYQAAQHRAGEAHALNAVAYNSALLHRYPQALRHCRQALSIATKLQDKRAEAHAWENLGYIHHRTGPQDQAITCYQRSLALHRELADRYHIAKLLRFLGDAHEAAGHNQAATKAWLESLSILDDLGHAEAAQVRDRITQKTALTPPPCTAPETSYPA